ncbi:hypothetical protein A6A12_2357 [Vibrio anguillarum]|nr:hypothetical protein A6A12_2357 [Vibrio anguillarum]
MLFLFRPHGWAKSFLRFSSNALAYNNQYAAVASAVSQLYSGYLSLL